MAARAKKIFAIVAGMLIAGVPMATLNYWLEGFVERQSQNEIDSAASRTIALVDYRIGRAVTDARRSGRARRGVMPGRSSRCLARRQSRIRRDQGIFDPGARRPHCSAAISAPRMANATSLRRRPSPRVPMSPSSSSGSAETTKFIRVRRPATHRRQCSRRRDPGRSARAAHVLARRIDVGACAHGDAEWHLRQRRRARHRI